MTDGIGILETSRLIIRPFVMGDLTAIHRILGLAFRDPGTAEYVPKSALDERRSWLEWQMMSYRWFGKLRQPPYGDRAVVLKDSGELIGSVGFVPLLMPFGQIAEFESSPRHTPHFSTEFGMFWAVDPKQQRKGYASEAAMAMIEHAFKQLRVKRIVATTEHANIASRGVMKKIGMKLLHNPSPQPSWFQVVGLLDNQLG